MRRKLKNWLIFMILLIINYLFAQYHKQPVNILVLHSYSPSMRWVEELNEGIKEVINSEHGLNMQVTYEFLDSKRYNSDLYFLHIAETLKFKYENTHFSAIISCDDHAFDFLKNFRDQCFENTPVFFCGVNNIYEKDLEGFQDFRGIFQVNPITENLKLIKTLLPDTKKILAVADPNTKTNRLYRQRINNELAGLLPDVKVDITDNISFSDLEEKLASLHSDTAVFYFSYIIDSLGVYLPHIASASRLLRRVNRPVFTMNKIFLDFNVIGGIVTDPKAHGAAVATMAADFLRGIPVSQTDCRDYITQSLYIPLFNQRMLEHYSISLKSLPEGSQFHDLALVSRNEDKRRLIMQSAVILLMGVILLYLFYLHMQNRKFKNLLINTENKWHSFADNFPNITFQLDPDGRFSFINSAVYHFFGLKNSDIIGKTAREAGFNENFCLMQEAYINSGNLPDSPTSFLFKAENPLSDHSCTCQVLYKPFYIDNQLNALIGSIFDVTRLAMEKDNFANESKLFNNFFRNSNCGVSIMEIITDNLGEIVSLDFIKTNNAFDDLFAYHFQKQHSREFFAIKQFEQVALTGKPLVFQKNLTYLDKSITVLAFNISTGIVGALYIDTTDQQNEVTSLKKQLDVVSKKFDEQLELVNQCKEQIRSKDNILKENNLFAGLGEILYDKIAAWNFLFDNMKNNLEDFRESLRHSSGRQSEYIIYLDKIIRLFSDLHESSQQITSAFNYRSSISEFDQAEVIEQVLHCLSERLQDNNISVRRDLQENCLLLGYPHEFALVIANLITNAMEAISTAAVPDGNISLTLQRKDDFQVLRIADNAGGIPPAFHQKIFEPFFSTKRKPTSSGLGLFICRKIINDNFNGNIYVQNTQKGAEFIIETTSI